MKKVLVALVVVIVAFLTVLGGSYFYATSNVEQMVLKMNVDELVLPEFTETTVVANSTTAKLHVNVPLLLGPAGTDQKIDISSTDKIDFAKNNVISKDSAGVETEVSLADYEKESDVFTDSSFWNKIIENKDYTVEDSKIGDDAMWKYTLDSNEISEKVKKSFEASILGNTALFDLGIKDLNVINWQINYGNGKFKVILYIAKSDYNIRTAIAEFDGTITIAFDMEGKFIDTLVGGFEQLQESYQTLDVSTLDESTVQIVSILEATGGEIPDANGTFEISEFINKSAWEETTLKDGKKTPNNPLTLLVFSKLM